MPYRDRTPRRLPSPVVRRVNAAVARLAGLGVGPKGTVALETVGRTSGRRRRTAVVVTEHEGAEYLVSLGGESTWVRNARAAGGIVTIRRGRAREVRLVGIPVEERAPILRSYASRRRTSRSPDRIAREYFGVSLDPSLAELEPIARFYPVFRIEDA